MYYYAHLKDFFKLFAAFPNICTCFKYQNLQVSKCMQRENSSFSNKIISLFEIVTWCNGRGYLNFLQLLEYPQTSYNRRCMAMETVLSISAAVKYQSCFTIACELISSDVSERQGYSRLTNFTLPTIQLSCSLDTIFMLCSRIISMYVV